MEREERKGKNVRMLIDEFGGIVDFIMNHDIEILLHTAYQSLICLTQLFLSPSVCFHKQMPKAKPQ